MTKEQHIQVHKDLHKSLDELVADMIKHTDKLPSDTTVIELIKWSFQQTIEPTEED